MATRVQPFEVIEIMDTALTENEVLPYITGANILVTKVLASTVLNDDQLKEIERWLTAHMITLSKERQSVEEMLGEASIKYAGEWGKGLNFTSYGQMVLSLDTSGEMANLGKRAAKVRAITSFE